MAVHVPAEIERQIDAFGQRTGESKEALVREALLTYREDAMIAASRLQTTGSRISLQEVGKKYGLVD